MKTGKVILIATPILVLGFLGYKWIAIPKISIEEIDRIKKTAKVKIGNQMVDYKFQKGMTLNVGKIGLFYTASIVSNGGTMESASVTLKRNGIVQSNSTTLNF